MRRIPLYHLFLMRFVQFACGALYCPNLSLDIPANSMRRIPLYYLFLMRFIQFSSRGLHCRNLFSNIPANSMRFIPLYHLFLMRFFQFASGALYCQNLFSSIPANSIRCILVMQCFLVGYRGTCHASLVFSVYTRVCIRRIYIWQVACSTVSHEKTLHNYFNPCLNLRKSYGNFGKSSEISVNIRKLRTRFKSVLDELKRFMKLLKSSETVQKCFPDVFMNF